MISQYNVSDKEGVRNLFAVGPWLPTLLLTCYRYGAWLLLVRAICCGSLRFGRPSFGLVDMCSAEVRYNVRTKIGIF